MIYKYFILMKVYSPLSTPEFRLLNNVRLVHLSVKKRAEYQPLPFGLVLRKDSHNPPAEPSLDEASNFITISKSYMPVPPDGLPLTATKVTVTNITVSVIMLH